MLLSVSAWADIGPELEALQVFSPLKSAGLYRSGSSSDPVREAANLVERDRQAVYRLKPAEALTILESIRLQVGELSSITEQLAAEYRKGTLSRKAYFAAMKALSYDDGRIQLVENLLKNRVLAALIVETRKAAGETDGKFTKQVTDYLDRAGLPPTILGAEAQDTKTPDAAAIP